MKYFFITLALVVISFAGYFYFQSRPNPKNLDFTQTPSSTVSSAPIVGGDEGEILKATIKKAIVAEHGPEAESLTIVVNKIEGNYAQGAANATAGGGLWFAAKVNGVWNLVYDGNGIITCAQVEPYPQFPASIIPACWDTTTNKLIKR